MGIKKIFIIVLAVAIAGGFVFYTSQKNTPNIEQQSAEIVVENVESVEIQPVSIEVEMQKPFPPDYILGDPNSKVQMIEYSSMTCPHCADYHLKIYPDIKKKYIDTGKIGYRLRHYPLDKIAFNAAKVTHCAGKDKYYKFVDVFFKLQTKWSHSGDPMKNLKSLALLGGMSETSFDECMENKELEKQLLSDMKDRAMLKHRVDSTPCVFINNKKITDDRSVDSISKAIDDLLK